MNILFLYMERYWHVADMPEEWTWEEMYACTDFTMAVQRVLKAGCYESIINPAMTVEVDPRLLEEEESVIIQVDMSSYSTFNEAFNRYLDRVTKSEEEW